LALIVSRMEKTKELFESKFANFRICVFDAAGDRHDHLSQAKIETKEVLHFVLEIKKSKLAVLDDIDGQHR